MSARNTLVAADGLGRAFEIGTGAASNTHVMYFRHPDYIQCEIIEPISGIRAVAGYGLEMRLLDLDGQVVAGGDNQTGFGKVYLGDKTDRNGGVQHPLHDRGRGHRREHRLAPPLPTALPERQRSYRGRPDPLQGSRGPLLNRLRDRDQRIRVIV